MIKLCHNGKKIQKEFFQLKWYAYAHSRYINLWIYNWQKSLKKSYHIFTKTFEWCATQIFIKENDFNIW